MGRLSFYEPAAEGHGPVDVVVRNPDDVSVSLENAGSDAPGVFLSYWQLERICKRIRQEFAYQLDREERERV